MPSSKAWCSDQAWALNSDLTGASLKGASLFMTQFIGETLDRANFENADVNSAKLVGFEGRDKAVNFDSVKNLERALTE